MRDGTAKKIAVIQIGKIGDMILMTPLFRKLKLLFPKCYLLVLASPANSQIASNDTNVDKVFLYTKNPAADLGLVLSDLRKCDVWIDTKPEKSDTSRLLLKVFAPRHSVGFNADTNAFDTNLSDFQHGNHAVDINLSPVTYFKGSIMPGDRLPVIRLADETIEKAKVFENDKPCASVIVNVSAGKEGRQLDASVWSEAILEIRKKIDVSVYTISHPDDRKIADEISERTGSVNIPTKDILETAAVIKLSDFVISPDTSIVHICSAFNKPLIALYPNVKWNYERFSPLSDNFESIISSEKDSIKAIKPHEIAIAFMRLYDRVTCGNAESRTRVRKEDH